jgi:hypothetical protein
MSSDGECSNKKSNMKQSKISDWKLADEQKLLQLPIDSIVDNYVRKNVPKVMFSPVTPTQFRSKLQLVCTR